MQIHLSMNRQGTMAVWDCGVVIAEECPRPATPFPSSMSGEPTALTVLAF
jgi:hypothetical protein